MFTTVGDVADIRLTANWHWIILTFRVLLTDVNE